MVGLCRFTHVWGNLNEFIGHVHREAITSVSTEAFYGSLG